MDRGRVAHIDAIWRTATIRVQIRHLPGVVYARPMVREGDEVTCSDASLPTWMGQLSIWFDDISNITFIYIG